MDIFQSMSKYVKVCHNTVTNGKYKTYQDTSKQQMYQTPSSALQSVIWTKLVLVETQCCQQCICNDHLVRSRRIEGLVVRRYDKDIKIHLPTTYSRSIMPANCYHISTPDVSRKWMHLEQIANQLLPIQGVGLLIGYNCSRAVGPRDLLSTTNPVAKRRTLVERLIRN